MRFTELLQEIKATYPEQPRAFHVLATRYYLGAESRETLELQSQPRPCNRDFCLQPVLTVKQVKAIIENR